MYIVHDTYKTSSMASTRGAQEGAFLLILSVGTLFIRNAPQSSGPYIVNIKHTYLHTKSHLPPSCCSPASSLDLDTTEGSPERACHHNQYIARGSQQSFILQQDREYYGWWLSACMHCARESREIINIAQMNKGGFRNDNRVIFLNRIRAEPIHLVCRIFNLLLYAYNKNNKAIYLQANKSHNDFLKPEYFTLINKQ